MDDKEFSFLGIIYDSELDAADYEKQLLLRVGEDIGDGEEEPEEHLQSPLGSIGLSSGAVLAKIGSSSSTNKISV